MEIVKINGIVARKGDIVVTLNQDNSTRKIVIESIYDRSWSFSDLSGVDSQQAVGRDITDFLSRDLVADIKEHIEFTDFGVDLVEVLEKRREIEFICPPDDKVNVTFRIQRSASQDGHPRFLLLIQNRYRTDLANRLRILETTKKSKTIDRVTGLGDQKSFLEESDVVYFYVDRGKITATMALVSIDNFVGLVQDHGRETGDNLLKEVILRFSQTFRQTDILGYLGKGLFGVILIEADAEDSRIPLNRLRWQVANRPVILPENVNFHLTLSIAYRQMNKREKVGQTMETCSNVLVLNSDNINQILEA